jgi:excisionase family DNA binding protein
MTDDEILTVKELAAYLKTAYRFASEGRLPVFKVGEAWRLRKSKAQAVKMSQGKSIMQIGKRI